MNEPDVVRLRHMLDAAREAVEFWKDIIGMRDRLIHGYFDVDLDVVWNVIVDDLPPLIAVLEIIIPPDHL